MLEQIPEGVKKQAKGIVYRFVASMVLMPTGFLYFFPNENPLDFMQFFFERATAIAFLPLVFEIIFNELRKGAENSLKEGESK